VASDYQEEMISCWRQVDSPETEIRGRIADL